MANYQNGTVTVGTTPTLIASPVQPGGILIQNNGTGVLYLGGPTVTADQSATGGLTVAAGATSLIPTVGGSSADGIYGIVATGTVKVAWLMPPFAN